MMIYNVTCEQCSVVLAAMDDGDGSLPVLREALAARLRSEHVCATNGGER